MRAGVATLRRARARRRHAALDPLKLDAIDRAFAELGCETFADLGGVWAVDGGYAAYAIEAHGARRGVLVDDDLSPAVRRHAERLPALELVEANFGTPEAAAAVGQVDAVLLFDVLLHQVAPDWDEILTLYAPHTRAFVVVGPQWNDDATVRLLDLGEAAYLAAVPSAGEAVYDGLFARLDEPNERRGRPWRDVHDIWQWGIADDDLVAHMDALGFACRLREDHGPWRGLERFHAGAFVFARR
ncbi:MAG TPA: hypothetical protein VF533_20850 [Solirubrobacteraceae bacterium]